MYVTRFFQKSSKYQPETKKKKINKGYNNKTNNSNIDWQVMVCVNNFFIQSNINQICSYI